MMMMIPVSCRRNTWSLLHVYPRRNTHEVQLDSRGPSTPHFVGVLLDLGSKAKRGDKIKYTVNSRPDEGGKPYLHVIAAFINIKFIHYRWLCGSLLHYNNAGLKLITQIRNRFRVRKLGSEPQLYCY